MLLVRCLASLLNGQCLTGVFYGFVDAGNQTQIDLSLEHGGRAVVTVTEDDVREWVRTVRGLDPAEFEFSALWAAFVQGHKVA
jgi:hypothetical protein